jgi:predicted MPP superfamily phosphohydrolase
LTSAIAGITQAAKGPKIYDIEIPLKDLPEQFEGFKIAQISDLHAGPTIGQHYTQKVVEMTNELNADVIALTGDFADGDVAHLRTALQPLAQLHAKHGVFFVTGNHEYYWDLEGWLAEYRRLGARVLLNEHVVLRHNGSEIVVAGVTDYTAGQMEPTHASDPAKSLKGAPANTIKILLAHQPASYEEAYKAGFDLQLSGHTHGGQFFPWSLVVRLVQKYYRGLNQHENMWVYVNRGTGYWGPPLRFTIPPEITLIRLRRKPA